MTSLEQEFFKNNVNNMFNPSIQNLGIFSREEAALEVYVHQSMIKLEFSPFSVFLKVPECSGVLNLFFWAAHKNIAGLVIRN